MSGSPQRYNARRPGRREALREVLERIDPEPIIAALETLATPRRRERIVEVGAARLNSVTLIMDAPHDPHNGAAIVRSCDAFGLQRVHVVERRETFAAANAVSKGAERWVDVIRHGGVPEVLQVLAQSGHVLVGTHPQGELLPAELASVPQLALVMGNEHDGISEQLEQACARHVRVPMRGYVESLNVSVSAAILLHAATRGRSGDLSAMAQRRLYARGLVLTVPRALDILAAKGVEPWASPQIEPGVAAV